MDLGIERRRAAVAAGSSGLGLGAAKALAAEGAHVALCGRDRQRLDRAVAEIGHDAVGVVCDVGSADGGAEFVGAATEVLGGPLDILVPNAGGPPPGTFTSTPVDAYPDALDLNLMSIIGMCKAAVPGMQERGRGVWSRSRRCRFASRFRTSSCRTPLAPARRRSSRHWPSRWPATA